MTVHTIPVKLIVPPGEPPYLDVGAPKDGILLKQMSTAQTIRWILQHHGSSGHFNALNDAISPGFLWISPPFPGIFGTPKVGERGQAIILEDQFNLEEKIGTWYYRLSATIDCVVYRTRFEPPFPARVRPLRSSRMSAAPTSGSTVTAPVSGTAYGPTSNAATNPTIKNR